MCAYLAYTLGNRGQTLPQGHWDHMEGHQGKAAFHILSWNPIEKATVHAKMIILCKAASSLSVFHTTLTMQVQLTQVTAVGTPSGTGIVGCQDSPSTKKRPSTGSRHPTQAYD